MSMVDPQFGSQMSHVSIRHSVESWEGMPLPLFDTPISFRDAQELGRGLLHHLTQEEVFLSEVRQSLQSIYDALCQGEITAIQQSGVELERVALRLEQLRQRRTYWLQALKASSTDEAPEARERTPGDFRDLTTEISRADPLGSEASGPLLSPLRVLAPHLEEDLRAELEAARERTYHLALEVEQLNQRTAILSQRCLGYVQECLVGILGKVEQRCPRYSSAGKITNNKHEPRGSLLEREG